MNAPAFFLDADRLDGSLDVSAELPTVEQHDHCLFVPFHATEPWGLFDRDGALIEAGLDRHGPERSLIGHRDTRPAIQSAAEIEDASISSPVIYIGRPHIRHFGHFLLSTVSRLWALRELLAEPLPLLYHGPPVSHLLAQAPIRSAFEALGLGPERFLRYGRPVRIPRVIVPATSFVERQRTHIEFRHCLGWLGDGLGIAHDSVNRSEQPLYISKSRLSAGNRRLVGEAELDEHMRTLGARILHPETLPLAEQAAVIAEHRVLVGTVGTGFHLAGLCNAPKQILALCPGPSMSANFGLLDALFDNRSRYIWVPRTRIRPGDGDFQQRFEIDDLGTVATELFRAI